MVAYSIDSGTWEAKAGRSHEDTVFKTLLGNMTRPHPLKRRGTGDMTQWLGALDALPGVESGS